MAEGEGGGNTGVVAIVVIFLVFLVLIFFAFRGGFFGGKKTQVDVNISAPGTGK